ncbi:MAG: RNA 2',3'-cyclic phosphodiesterase [Balneolaceae bacterium]|nr:RNA 2',3'-cyclic phosphodiesterase [Balneolaceae bacterium]
MRLFTAIAVPNEIKAGLHELYTSIEGVRWQDTSQMHLTLRFIGEVTAEIAERLVSELQQVSVSPFHLELNGLGTFPESGKPKVIWVGVEPESRLQELHRQIESACQQAGLEPDNRSFTPHITLGRNKGKASKGIRDYLDRQKVPEFNPIPVTEFCLFRSELTAKGAIHHLEKKFSLAPE